MNQHVDASNDEAIALIREELLAEHRDALAQLESTRRALQGTQETLSTERRTRLESQAELDAKTRAVQDAEAKAAAAEQVAANEAASRKSLEEQLRLAKEEAGLQLKAKMETAEATERRLVRQRYVLAFAILPLLLGVVLAYVCYGLAVTSLPALAQGWKRWAFVAGTGLLPFASACLLSPMHADENKHLSDWWVCKWAKHLGRKGIAAPVTSALTAVYQGGAWDWFKAAAGLNP
ncbi:hypothetical protein HF896_14070 [Alicycliphilus denitrificans]|uniref:Transmembrane protein n=1 Tax=Alicycliphilus denitrificans TaxID=179636 RepID=A0A858ZV96_9BURK|nr:hypothetical protein [Alicycliphilus denitrificans]QKD44673.1 hypothetical protein HF896_14070 [Alicycliphilus denitrificans]